jgi:hypothetical protein
MIRHAVMGLAGLVLFASPAAAQDSESHDTPLEYDRRDFDDDPAKFFMFHREATDYDTALADISYCHNLAAPARPADGGGVIVPAAPGGLLGALIVGAIAGAAHGIGDSIRRNVAHRRLYNAGMRNCMTLYGYQRYYMAEIDWNPVNDAEDSLEQWARLASGDRPTTRRLPQ